MCFGELYFYVVLIESEIPVLPAAELRMPIHVVDGQLPSDAGKVLRLLRGIFDIAGLLLLAKEVSVSYAQVFDGLFCDII